MTVAGEAPAITSLEDFVVITGFSGAGKSTAMNVFEDDGYFCVDNLPPEMIRGLVDLFVHEGSNVRRAAVVSDVRARELFETLSAVLDDLGRRGVAHRVLFLDADEDTLLGRYKETRRRHPLSPTGSVANGIANERDALQHIKARADLVLDTSGIGAATLRRRIADEFLPRQARSKLAVTLTSFGHKHGLPRDADIVLDMRFLPNPHWVPELRPLTGFDPQVVEYMSRDGKLEAFYERLGPLLDFLLPEYIAEGKAHLAIAVGCTGGRHRSVAITEALAARLRVRDDVEVDVVHRDIGNTAR
ncbi:MAG: RNase adapter protein RapZ [Solirubrobacteraceae bacterium]|nr:RNase adapter protein RapZ [Solirubrobacteraceae bacterium]